MRNAPNGAKRDKLGRVNEGRPPEAASSRDIVEKTGMSKGEVHRGKSRASALGPDLSARINRTSLDRPSEVDALIAMPEPEREKLVAAAEAEASKPEIEHAKVPALAEKRKREIAEAMAAAPEYCGQVCPLGFLAARAAMASAIL